MAIFSPSIQKTLLVLGILGACSQSILFHGSAPLQERNAEPVSISVMSNDVWYVDGIFSCREKTYPVGVWNLFAYFSQFSDSNWASDFSENSEAGKSVTTLNETSASDRLKIKDRSRFFQKNGLAFSPKDSSSHLSSSKWGNSDQRKQRADDSVFNDYVFDVDLNTACWQDFALFPGLGETLSQRIVEYRHDHGDFQSVKDLVEVKGIGPKKCAAVEPFFYVLPKVNR